MAGAWRQALVVTKNAMRVAPLVWLGWIAAVSVSVWLVQALRFFLQTNPRIELIHEEVLPIDFLLAVVVAAGVSGAAFVAAPREERDPTPGAFWSTIHVSVLVLSLVAVVVWMLLGSSGDWDWNVARVLGAIGVVSSTVFWAHDPRLAARFAGQQESHRVEQESRRAQALADKLEEALDE